MEEEMRQFQMIFILGLICAMMVSTAQGRSLHSYWPSYQLFDEIVGQARDNPQLKNAALHFLKVVAEGLKDEISAELLSDFGSRGNFFHPKQLADLPVRARAFEQIGRLATPDALAYLESIDLSQFTAVEDQPFATSIPFGIFLAKAGQIHDVQRRWEFYAETLRNPPDGLGRSGPLALAYRGLCTEGALAFYPDVEAYVRRENNTAAGEDQIRSCKQMMHLVASHSNRAAALETALHADPKVYGRHFRSWAIQELDEMYTNESRAVLERFVNAAKSMGGATLDAEDLARDVRSAELALTRLVP